MVEADFRIDHPMLQNLPVVGRGEHSVVFAKDGERVYKLTDCPAAYAILTAPDRPRGCHYPQVFQDFGVVGRAPSGPLYLVEMERLEPLQAGTAAWLMATSVQQAYMESCRAWYQLGENMAAMAFHSMLRTPLGLSADVHSALEDLRRFMEENQIRPDLLNRNNMMVRRDGTLVFSDPVFV